MPKKDSDAQKDERSRKKKEEALDEKTEKIGEIERKNHEKTGKIE